MSPPPPFCKEDISPNRPSLSTVSYRRHRFIVTVQLQVTTKMSPTPVPPKKEKMSRRRYPVRKPAKKDSTQINGVVLKGAKMSSLCDCKSGTIVVQSSRCIGKVPGSKHVIHLTCKLVIVQKISLNS
ncbi:hypothetical protein JTE90_021297 [Oedothorax gibbosus]|uniref:Uncharacterized protein n=1 Tax=Oedothorax gibbosus TaxID=931172 RepID=A0AAV6VP93_9ARAC|nr:hypothetical protein JTE90_021297 [Oedothorax gibbosus]